MTSVQGTGARVEELLAALRASGPGPAADAAEELVGLLVGLYGEGLTAITEILAGAGPAGSALLAQVADDPRVEGLLLLHDLHPLSVDERVQRALDRVRPYLGSHAGGVQYQGVTDGVARLLLEGSCHGCPSSAVTVELAITSAVQDAAPEVERVVVEGMTAPPEPGLLQIGSRPPGDAPAPAGDAGTSWITLPDVGPPSSRPVTATAAGASVLLCSVRGTLYAYLDACAACGSAMGEGQLEREELTCPGCGHRYNVRLAGQGIDDPAAHLDPLPLLADSHGVRVAVPEAAAS
jgi:Fe-S cluster biogenesis protein NfuA/nitrite reductase/ring-hydroxylating ferredoxin subunit